MEVAVIGDVILDEYAFGRVERISPEAPVPVFLYKSSKFLPGGAANVALNLAKLNVSVHLYGIVGEDEDGERILDICKSVGINARLLKSKLRTLKKVRMISKNHHVIRIDYEEKYSREDAYDLLDMVKTDVDAIVISNYEKGTVVEETLNFVRNLKLLKAIDPKSLIWKTYEFDIVKPNLSELGKAVNRNLESVEDVLEASLEVFDRMKPEAMVSTMGDRGMFIITEKDRIYVPAHKREVFDITGAGDTVLAWVVWGRLKGLDWRSIGEISSRAAAITVSKLGAYAPTLQEVESAFNSAL